MIVFSMKWLKRAFSLPVGVVAHSDPASLDPAPKHAATPDVTCRRHRQDDHLRRNGPLFECFPYVCPEPVLVKCSF
jgi:hypothetical protein